MITRTLVAIALLALTLAPAGSAEPAESLWFHVPTAPIPTCDRTFVVSGKYHIVMRLGTDGAGGSHNLWRSVFQGTAIDEDGTDYRYKSSAIATANFVAAGEITLIMSTRFVEKGGPGEIELRTHVHFTTNANGEPTATVVHSEVDCD